MKHRSFIDRQKIKFNITDYIHSIFIKKNITKKGERKKLEIEEITRKIHTAFY